MIDLCLLTQKNQALYGVIGRIIALWQNLWVGEGRFERRSSSTRASLALCGRFNQNSGRHILESRCAERCANDAFSTSFRATLSDLMYKALVLVVYCKNHFWSCTSLETKDPKTFGTKFKPVVKRSRRLFLLQCVLFSCLRTILLEETLL